MFAWTLTKWLLFFLLCLFATSPACGVESYTRGKEYYKKGFYDLAQAEFEKDLRVNPKSARSHFYLGILQFSQNHVASAIEHFQQAVALDYYLPGGHYASGICFKKIGDLARAEAAFRKAVKTEPLEAKNYFNWGVCLTRLRRYDEAIYAFKHAISLDRDNTYSYYNLADLYRLTNNYAEAIVHYDVVIRKKPEFSRARFGKGLALYSLGRTEEALLEFLKAAELSPDDPKVYGFVAASYAKLGRQDKAKEYQEYYTELTQSALSRRPDQI